MNILNPEPGLKLLLTPKAAAAALGICERTLWELTHRGDLTALRLPGRGNAPRALRYAVDDLRAWVDRLKVSVLPNDPNGV